MGDPRQCPICGGADQHAQDCALNGKEHIRRPNFFEDIDWPATLELNGLADIADYDVPGARWVDYLTPQALYEEQLDTNRIDGKWRHRARVKADEPLNRWEEGRAPLVHIDTRSGARVVDRTL